MEWGRRGWNRVPAVLWIDYESGNEVQSLDEASPAIQEAVEWLQARGDYIEIGVDADGGEHVLVKNKPGDDSLDFMRP